MLFTLIAGRPRTRALKCVYHSQVTISGGILKRHMVFGVIFAALATAGCGGEADRDTDAVPSDLESSATASPSPSADPDPHSPDSHAAASAPAEADFESCQDGECEVSFTGSVEFPVEGPDGQWTVEAAVEGDGTRVTLTKPDGMGGGGGLLYSPLCTFAARSDGGGSLSCVEEGRELPEPEAGGVVVHLLEHTGDTALIGVALG